MKLTSEHYEIECADTPEDRHTVEVALKLMEHMRSVRIANLIGAMTGHLPHLRDDRPTETTT